MTRESIAIMEDVIKGARDLRDVPAFQKGFQQPIIQTSDRSNEERLALNFVPPIKAMVT